MTATIQDGQCGLCKHFGEHHPEESEKLLQIRQEKKGPENLLEECGHPVHSQLHLLVTVTSGCNGFERASA